MVFVALLAWIYNASDVTTPHPDSAGWRPLPAGARGEVQPGHGVRPGDVHAGAADGQPTLLQGRVGLQPLNGGCKEERVLGRCLFINDLHFKNVKQPSLTKEALNDPIEQMTHNSKWKSRLTGNQKVASSILGSSLSKTRHPYCSQRAGRCLAWLTPPSMFQCLCDPLQVALLQM